MFTLGMTFIGIMFAFCDAPEQKEFYGTPLKKHIKNDFLSYTLPCMACTFLIDMTILIACAIKIFYFK